MSTRTSDRLTEVIKSIDLDKLTIGQGMYIIKRSEAMRAFLMSQTAAGRIGELLRQVMTTGKSPAYPDNRDL